MTPTSSPWRFLRDVAWFAALPAVVVCALEVLLWRSGETRPVGSVSDLQDDLGETHYQRALISQSAPAYKLARLERIPAPHLLVVGSSRVLQIREDMLPGLDGRLFNAGGTVRSVPALEHLVERLLESGGPLPDCVLLGIDPWWLTRRERDPPKPALQQAPADAALDVSEHMSGLRGWVTGGATTWRVSLAGAGETGRDDTPGCIGIGALRAGAGYRPDGSYRYPQKLYRGFLADPRFRDRDTAVGRLLRRGSRPYIRHAVPDTDATDRLAAAVGALRERGVTVLVYMPPLAARTIRTLSSDPGYGSWWPWVRRKLGPRLHARRVRYVDTHDIEALGASDLYMIDGHHPSEVANLLVLARLAEAAPDSPLGSLDVGALRKRAAACADFPLALTPPR